MLGPSPGTMLESLAQAAPDLDAAEWRVLGVLALERRLSASQVEALREGVGRGFVGRCHELG